MHIRRLTADADESALRRYVSDLWLPFNRELEAVVEGFALADLPVSAIIDAEVDFRRDRLDESDFRLWVAVDGARKPGDAPGEADDGPTEADDGLAEADDGLAEADGALAGFVAVDRDESPPVFDRPDRVTVCDVYVREAYRGTGLAQELMARAAAYARETGCSQVALDVDADNDRAIAFYEKLGFEPSRHEMTVDVADR